jgi:RimJ/RimL family protein N-acetyltransferase
MADPIRAEEVTLRDGRKVLLRPVRVEDAPSLMRNANLVREEEVYIMLDAELDEVKDLEKERRWIGEFDGVRNAMFVADAAGEVIGAADCHGGKFAKDRHVGGLGIAIRPGWREVGLGRLLMERVLEWMRTRGFRKAELAVFATNGRAVRLYESLGFREEGVRRGHVMIRGDYIDEVLMGLWLGDVPTTGRGR